MGRIKGRGISAGVMGVLAGIFLIVSLVSMGWYYISTEVSGGDENYESGFEFGLSEGEMYAKSDGESEEEELDYDEGRDENSEIVEVFDFVLIFVIIGMILAFIFAVLAFLAGARLIPGWISLIVGLITAIAIIVGPVYMIFTLPGAFEEDFGGDDEDGPHNSFWGSDSESMMGTTVKSSWGPYWCWYLTAGASIMLFSAAGMCGGIKRKKSKKYKHGYPPAPGYGQPPRDPYGPPPPRPHDELYGPPPPRPHDERHGPPRRSRDPYDDHYPPPPTRGRDPYDEPRGPPRPRDDDYYPPPPRQDYY